MTGSIITRAAGQPAPILQLSRPSDAADVVAKAAGFVRRHRCGPSWQGSDSGPRLFTGQRFFPVAKHVDIKSVRVIQISGRMPFLAGNTVLPDDFLGLAIDHHDAIA